MNRYLQGVARAAVEKHGAVQKVWELATFLEAMAARLPEQPVIVELGCDAGGGLFAWRSLSRNVFGVDLPGINGGTGRPLNTWGATVVEGDSHHSETIERLANLLLKRTGGVTTVDLLIIDADHSWEGIRRDWFMYAPLVKPGGVVAFHDILPNPASPFGVPRFWATFVPVKSYNPAPFVLGRNAFEIIDERTRYSEKWGGIGWVIVP